MIDLDTVLGVAAAERLRLTLSAIANNPQLRSASAWLSKGRRPWAAGACLAFASAALILLTARPWAPRGGARPSGGPGPRSSTGRWAVRAASVLLRPLTDSVLRATPKVTFGWKRPWTEVPRYLRENPERAFASIPASASEAPRQPLQGVREPDRPTPSDVSTEPRRNGANPFPPRERPAQYQRGPQSTRGAAGSGKPVSDSLDMVRPTDGSPQKRSPR